MSSLRSGFCVLAFVVACVGCRARAAHPPPAVATPTAEAPAISFDGVGPEGAKLAFKKLLFKAVKPRVTAVDAVDEAQYRYRASGFLGRTNTVTVTLYTVGRVEVAKGTWVFVFDGNDRRIDKVKFKTVADADEYRALVEYVAGDEYGALAEEAKKARLAAQRARPSVAPAQPASPASPCSICGEPRGDVTPCPHCGME